MKRAVLTCGLDPATGKEELSISDGSSWQLWTVFTVSKFLLLFSWGEKKSLTATGLQHPWQISFVACSACSPNLVYNFTTLWEFLLHYMSHAQQVASPGPYQVFTVFPGWLSFPVQISWHGYTSSRPNSDKVPFLSQSQRKGLVPSRRLICPLWF